MQIAGYDEQDDGDKDYSRELSTLEIVLWCVLLMIPFAAAVLMLCASFHSPEAGQRLLQANICIPFLFGAFSLFVTFKGAKEGKFACRHGLVNHVDEPAAFYLGMVFLTAVSLCLLAYAIKCFFAD